MCGIVGYAGAREAAAVLISGLRRLEYRGYDSAGVAILSGGHAQVLRCRGKLAALEKQYREPESNFIPVYGRRRVGKSELILHFKKGRPCVYFVGKQAPTALQVREFLRTASRALNEPLLAKADITDWKASLSEVVQRWRGPGKLILVLDEFQWMVEEDRSLPSVVQ